MYPSSKPSGGPVVNIEQYPMIPSHSIPSENCFQVGRYCEDLQGVPGPGVAHPQGAQSVPGVLPNRTELRLSLVIREVAGAAFNQTARLLKAAVDGGLLLCNFRYSKKKSTEFGRHDKELDGIGSRSTMSEMKERVLSRGRQGPFKWDMQPKVGRVFRNAFVYQERICRQIVQEEMTSPLHVLFQKGSDLRPTYQFAGSSGAQTGAQQQLLQR
ncbi:hypothetical protein BJ166DRAFT_496696 [Pestalotiopsis sp. NC0098]|nr:hypothetical protein BJ166DRAFT_496696 [Pestalotiopsis sp. NC0098]